MQPFNKYFPSDFDPSKHNSVNQHLGKHPLGNRARKLKSHGVLIVRFELPFNIWCLGCNNHVGMGVRFNAEKKKVGNYHSTPILSFRMKCHLCANWFEIQTDPQNTCYVVVEGARQRIEEYTAQDAQVTEIKDESEARKLESNAFYKLEHTVRGQKAAQVAKTTLEELKELADEHWEDDFTHNQKLRSIFRRQKAIDTAEKRGNRAIAERIGTNEQILPETNEDRIKAKLVEFPDKVLQTAQKRKLAIRHSSLFASTTEYGDVLSNQKSQTKLSMILPVQETHHVFDDDLIGVKLKRSLPNVISNKQRRHAKKAYIETKSITALAAYESSNEENDDN